MQAGDYKVDVVLGVTLTSGHAHNVGTGRWLNERITELKRNVDNMSSSPLLSRHFQEFNNYFPVWDRFCPVLRHDYDGESGLIRKTRRTTTVKNRISPPSLALSDPFLVLSEDRRLLSGSEPCKITSRTRQDFSSSQWHTQQTTRVVISPTPPSLRDQTSIPHLLVSPQCSTSFTSCTDFHQDVT